MYSYSSMYYNRINNNSKISSRIKNTVKFNERLQLLLPKQDKAFSEIYLEKLLW